MENIFGKRPWKKSKVVTGNKGSMAKTNGKLVDTLSDDSNGNQNEYKVSEKEKHENDDQNESDEQAESNGSKT
jgi:hypothetical protein